MVRTTAAVVLAGLCAGACAFAQTDEGAPAGGGFATPEERSSYALGLGFAKSLNDQKVAVNLELLIAGLQDGLGQGSPRLTEQETQTAIRELQQQIVRRQQEERQALGQKSKEQGEAFLAANKERAGVVTLPSGLQYEVLQEGTGPQPTATDQVSVHYKGTLVDGTPFDSSYDRGQPARLRADRVIRGWSEALPMMKVGAKWKLFVPSSLAYGDAGAGASIPPHAALIFEVELLAIEPPAGETPQAAEPRPEAAGQGAASD